MLLDEVGSRLRALADDAVAGLLAQLPQTVDDPSAAGTVLEGRLLAVHDRLPAGNSLVELLREMLGDLGDDSPVRLHGWRRSGGSQGLALVMTSPDAGLAAGRAVLGVTPAAGGPVFDVVVTPGSNVVVPEQRTGPWTAAGTATSPEGWDAAFGPGLVESPPGGTVGITVRRTGRLSAGMAGGPGISVEAVGLTVAISPGRPATFALGLTGLRAAVLPVALADLVGVSPGGPMAGDGSVDVVLDADRVGGLRFRTSAALRVDLPLRMNSPGVQSRGAAVTVSVDGGDVRLGLSLSLTAGLPGLPVQTAIDGAGIDLPVLFAPGSRVGLDPRGLRELFPEGIGVDLNLPPVSGGGDVTRLPDGSYAGLVAISLGVLRLQAFAVFRPPDGAGPTTFLLLLAASFPAPGIQVGLGFALDGVGGVVGVNRRVDVSALSQLVREGNVDRVLFPDDAADHAGEIIAALTSAFPVGAGRMVIGPMVRLNWGGRIVSLSGSLVLELPAPVTAVLLGRLLVAMPDPALPLVRLQASVLGQVDPGIPKIEVLVSLAGSWIVGLAVRGEMYLLVRGGDQPEFVVSAGGFHPRYTRPPGVPALQRLQIDLAPGGGFGLSVEAYFAVTSNAVMFGGQVRLAAMIAGCGVEGWLGLDTLFVFDPVFAFSAHVRAGVAVRAFGKRLAGIALDFTLEGPAPWHAFGTGTISVLFWDVSLDFDVRWGAPPAIAAVRGRDPADSVRQAIARAEAWTAERPAVERTALVFTATAQKRLAAGTLVHPDATVRVTQKVVPLGVAFSRFERRPVSRQQWIVAAVTVGEPLDTKDFTSLPERFVPGEYFELDDDQQLTAHAFDSYAGGVQVGVDDASVGPGHRVVDGYETAYEPERGRDTRAWPGIVTAEAVFAVSAAARVERWRTAAVTVAVRSATLSVADATSLQPVSVDVSLVNATADAWLAIRDQLPDPAVPVQLVESWELAL